MVVGGEKKKTTCSFHVYRFDIIGEKEKEKKEREKGQKGKANTEESART